MHTKSVSVSLYETNTLCIFLYEKNTVNIWNIKNDGLRIQIYYHNWHFILCLLKSSISKEELLQITESYKKELDSIYAIHIIKWSDLVHE